ncbi:hypothetical protein CH352_00850 [Leptospira hartskeerlii]|uniref:Uncharacterized protein n=1 Tax=Leptospira hartskeerlii TaxID=2023177 RepID=A0A2M9X8S6_9LEPT|nr:hypothetical protein [Leptospira hartskeerlii]PJZ23952.1 hypothetical protein CH357_18430 [Leptospira hartskeerlii]PJZ35216.1 hypothetical protein CH352_00850 [Leptospira hartskeerlii]
MKVNIWKELDSVGIQHFRKILHTLNTFYKEVGFQQNNNLIYNKERLVSEENIKILIKKLGSCSKNDTHYEYLIYAQLTLRGFRKENENWIHIDGIQLERERLSGMGVVDHPAFDIMCMTDLYCKFSNAVKEDEVPNISDLK